MNTDHTESTPKASKRIIGIVFLTVLLDLIGFGIIIPVQPFLAKTLGASPTVVTILGASFSLMQFLFASFWGRLSDRLGRRPIMLISISISAIGYTIFGFAQSLPLLFFARMLAGFGSANLGTAQAIIADCTAGKDRAKGMGIIGAAFGLGFIFGPALGGLFGRISLSAPVFVAASLCAINVIIAYFFLPETNRPVAGAKGHGASHRPGFSWQALTKAARHPNVKQLFIIYLIYFSSFSLMEQVLALFIEYHWATSTYSGDLSFSHMKQAASLTAYFLIVVGVTATIVQGGLIGRLVKWFGERALFIFGLLVVSLAFCAIPLAGELENYRLLLGVAVVMAVGTGLVTPSASSLLSRSALQDEQGGVLGLGQSIAALGRVIGPSVAGRLFEISHDTPFWVGGIFIGVCSFLALTIKDPKIANQK